MKKTVRSALTITMASVVLLGTSGCSSFISIRHDPTPSASTSASHPAASTEHPTVPTPAPVETQPQETAHPTPAAASAGVQVIASNREVIKPTGTTKDATFTASMDTSGAPVQWRTGTGWTEKHVKQMVSLPNHIAYTVQDPAHPNDVSFKIYDGSGALVQETRRATELGTGDVSQQAVTVWKNGKMFVAYVQNASVVNEDNSVVVSVITVFDQDANRISRTVATGQVSSAAASGQILISNYEDQKSLDPETGEVTPNKSSNADSLVGVFDGVAVTTDMGSGSSSSTFNGAGWSHPNTGFIYPMGKYITVPNPENKKCTILDPHSGTEVGGNEDACFPYDNGAPDGKTVPASSTNGFILQNQNSDYVCFLPDDKAIVRIIAENYVQPYSVGPDGTFYARLKENSSSAYVYSMNPKVANGYAVLDGVKDVPVAISGNSIAAFSADTYNSPYAGEMRFVLPKA